LVSDAKSRQEGIELLDKHHPGAKMLYSRALKEIQPFDPVEQDRFNSKFPDFTPTELEKIWNWVFGMGEEGTCHIN
jgi:hypothetical protein